MYYDKQIHYIDYLENGEKRYNCGYVKITIADGAFLLEMQIRGLYETDDITSEVALLGAGAERRIGSVQIRQGSGSFRWEMRDPVYVGENIFIQEGLRYGQLEQIVVQLSSRRSLQCIWRKPEIVTEIFPAAVPETGEPERLPEEDYAVPGKNRGVPENLQEEPGGVLPEEDYAVPGEDRELPEIPQEEPGGVLPEEDYAVPREDRGIPEISQEEPKRTQPEDENTEGEQKQQKYPEEKPVSEPDTGREAVQTASREAGRRALHGPRTAVMSEEKWQQLWKIYPHVRPFQDDREYLSLWPEDFVILRSEAYRLAHNSFLLHGYYNYEHLVLTQIPVKGVNRYYIGVPGNFYEKEKQVAIMFGFESFECRQEPAQEGDFGYYMIRVEL